MFEGRLGAAQSWRSNDGGRERHHVIRRAKGQTSFSEGSLRRCRHLLVGRPDFRSRFEGGEVNLRPPDPGVEGKKDRGAGDSPGFLPSGL